MSAGISESRFYMWRAVFAMVHADHVVTDEERAFMDNYLRNVPFSEQQREILIEDMSVPQQVEEMFFNITEPEDQGAFFQFARELVWCDGDLAAQEDAIKERLKQDQMSRVNLDRLELELHKHRAEARLDERAEERKMESQAGEILGFGAFVRRMVGRKTT